MVFDKLKLLWYGWVITYICFVWMHIEFMRYGGAQLALYNFYTQVNKIYVGL